MNNLIDVYIQLDEGVELPEYQHIGDSGIDLRSTIDITIKPDEVFIIPTGIRVAIPEGYELQIRPRSGLSYKTKLRISNSPGTIDASFRDEIGIIVHNITNKINDDIQIKKGDRICQAVLQRVPKINWIIVDDVKEYGYNRNGGFGSTGID